MGKTFVQQQVMDVISIRAERTAAMKNADTKHTECIQQRYHQNGEADRG